MLDDTFKITEEIIDVENEGKDNNKELVIHVANTSPSHKILCPQLPKDVIMLNKDENGTLNKSICSLFGTSNNTTNSLNTNFSHHEKSLNENTNDSAMSKMFGNLINDTTQVTNRESTDRNSLDKSKKINASSDRSSMEPIEPSNGTFDCSDEFININLLDNPDFLKKVSNHSSDISRIDIKNLTANESKMEDSDIEIVDIDDTEIILTKNIKSESKDNHKKESIDTNEKVKVDTEKNETKEQSCKDVKDVKDVPSNTNENSSNITKMDKPLTLDDIKDTGISGTKLYKCGYEGCKYSGQTAAHLRLHAKECSSGGGNKNLSCVHCNKRFLKIGFLLEHLKSHGLKRFGCSLCKMRCTVGYQAMQHMKMKHKYPYSKLVPADPKNPSVDGLFIVQPIVSVFYENI